MGFISAHKAYNTEWYCTSSKNPLRPLMRKTGKEKSILRTIFAGTLLKISRTSNSCLLTEPSVCYDVA